MDAILILVNGLILVGLPLGVTFSIWKYFWRNTIIQNRIWLGVSAVLGLVVPILWFQVNNPIWMLPLWPTSILLMATDGHEKEMGSYVLVAISAFMNVLLYTCIGGLGMKLIRRAK